MNEEPEVMVDWHLVGVGPSVDEGEDFIPFAYTVDLGETKNEVRGTGSSGTGGSGTGSSEATLPELWIRCRGTCGHTLSVRAAGWVLNQAAEMLILGKLQPGGTDPEPAFRSGVPSTWSEDFTSGTLTFTLEEGLIGAQDLLETYQAPADAVMVPISWACCEGKQEAE